MSDTQSKSPEKIKEYLKKLNLSSTNRMFENTITQAFLLMLHDFKYGLISLDELCSMAEELANRLAKVSDYNSETSRILEKTYYLHNDLRTIQNETNADIFVDKFRQMLDFYDKNKYAIKSIIRDD